VTATITLAGIAVAYSMTLTDPGGTPAKGGPKASVSISIDLNHAVAALAEAGFRSLRTVEAQTNCASASTGEIRQFLAAHHCDKLVMAGLTLHGQGFVGWAGVSWVTMPSASLAARYEGLADAFGTGNPPEPAKAPRFDGQCYASGRRGRTVWTEMIQPEGAHTLGADREILKGVAPEPLAPGYVQRHCIS
jgi:hypothetical protein